MDKDRRLKFIGNFHQALEDYLKKEKHPGIKRELEELFFQKSEEELITESQPQAPNDIIHLRKKKGLFRSRISFWKETLEKKHFPQHTVNFLALFSLDKNVKYLTHTWDSNLGQFEYFKYMFEVLEKLNEAVDDYKFTPASTLKKIHMFLCNEDPEKGWGFEHVKMGWSYPEIQEWCKKNPGVYPDRMVLPENKRKYSASGKEIEFQFFEDVINKFKKEIRFINAGNHFLKFLKRKSREFGLTYEHQPEFDDSLKGLDFYIDVDRFASGLKQIFDGIRSRTEYPRVIFSATKNADHIAFTIFQEGGKITRSSPEEEKIRKETLSGNFKDAERNLFSQCDWSFEGPFLDGKAYRINYLASGKLPPVEQSNSNDGVRHVFRFYKPTINS